MALPFRTINKEEFCRQGADRYQALHERLSADYPGEVVAIDPQSGDYFVAPTLVDATTIARNSHPDALSFYVRIPPLLGLESQEVKTEVVVGGLAMGRIGPQGGPHLLIRIKGTRQEVSLEATIDWRFEGFLAMPVEIAVQLGLECVGWQQSTLAEKSQEYTPIFVGTVSVADQECQADISLSETAQAVIGRGLFDNYEAEIDFSSALLRLGQRISKFARVLQRGEPLRSKRDQILAALLATNWNVSKAAQRLSKSRMTVYRHMAKYQIIPRRSPRIIQS